MSGFLANSLTVAILTVGLWLVPSVGTRGQGTIGHGTLDDRFVHVDRAIVAGSDTGLDEGARAVLHRADAAVAAAVADL